MPKQKWFIEHGKNLNSIIATHCKCSCTNDLAVLDLTRSNCLVFLFPEGQTMKIAESVVILGIQFQYICHFEDSDEIWKSNFRWFDKMYGMTNEGILSESYNFCASVKVIVVAKTDDHIDKTNSFTYDQKALRVHSKRATEFLNPQRAKEIRTNSKKYFKAMNKTEART